KMADTDQPKASPVTTDAAHETEGHLSGESSTASAPLEHVSERAEDHDPSELPPDGLPQAALDNMSDTAKAQLADHVDWLISGAGDQLTFASDAPNQTPNVRAPLEHVPEQAEDHVPAEVPPNGLPQDALDQMQSMQTGLFQILVTHLLIRCSALA